MALPFDPEFPYYDGPPIAGPSSNSPIDLNLAQVPPDNIEDPAVYQAMLDIYNALEILQTGTDSADQFTIGYINKQRKNTAVTGNYTILITDGTIEVDATAGNIIITAHPVSEGVGFEYDIKRVDLVTANKVTLVGDGSELIDGRVSGINISTKSSYTIKTNENDTGWNII